MSYILVIEVDIQKTDPNRMIGRHWKTKDRLFSRVKEQVRLLTLNRRPPTPLESFQITVTRHAPRTMDWDNLVSSLKPVIDALTLSKIIRDDNWSYIKNIPIDQVMSKEKKLVIEVREVA